MLAGVVAALHAIGIGLLLGTGALLGVGVGATAYTLGLRHGFDADHIGAIDNTTRKLLGDGRRPLSVGFFFALGHSTIVFSLPSRISRMAPIAFPSPPTGVRSQNERFAPAAR